MDKIKDIVYNYSKDNISEFAGNFPTYDCPANGKCHARAAKRSSEACADWGVLELICMPFLLG